MFEEKDDPTYAIFSELDNYLETNPPIPNKNYFNMVWEKNNLYCIKFKLYMNTELFDINKNKIEVKTFHDFYHFIKRGTKVRFVFGFSKLWMMGKDFGFAPAVRRVQLFGDKDDVPQEKIKFVDDD